VTKTNASKNIDPSLKSILTLIKAKTQVDLSHYKMSTIRRRVERHMRMKKVPTLTKYASFLKSHPEALMELYEDVFVHVTEFFRDPEAFEAVKKTVFPAITKGKSPGDPVRFWVTGCSSGEEAYSLAIAFTEYMKQKKLSFKLTVFATDISSAVVQFARRAQYPEETIQKITSKKLLTYFEKDKDFYRIKKEIRDLVVFSEHDLISNPPISKLDLITCRNVLIYFGPELQKKIFPMFNFGLNKEGYLWLGTSETTGTSSGLFETVDKKFRIFKKIPTNFALNKKSNFLSIPFQTEVNTDPTSELQRTADKYLLSRLAPTGVIINSHEEVVQFRGKTAPFLSVPSGSPTTSLFKMAHPDIAPYLKKMIHEAATKKTVRKDGVNVYIGNKPSKVNIEISRLNPQHLLILFTRVEEKESAPKKVSKKKPILKGDKSDLELIQELQVQRDYLQSIFEQYELTQADLMSANEELQAANEELHSANEEMESAKEELQCANEELTTANEELGARNSDLVRLNEELARSEERFRLMVTSVRDYAIFMLDPQGRITSWNEGAKRFKGYDAPEIIGKHFSVFYTAPDKARKHPEWELEKATKEGRYEEEGWRVRKDGSQFWANIVITRINDRNGNMIGFSKVTRDLTERRNAEEELKQSEERMRLMISAVKDYAILMLDRDGTITSWNEGATRIKGWRPEEVIGKNFSIFYLKEDIARNHPQYELKIATEEGRYEEEGWRVRKDGTRFWANVVITRINDSSGSHIGFVKVTRDLTDKKRADEALKSAYEDLERRVKERTQDLENALKSRDEFLSIASHELKTPLTSLRLQLQLSSRRVDRSESADPIFKDLSKSFDVGIRQVNSLTHLVNDLLDISRIQTGNFELNRTPVNLSELVDEIALRFKEQIEQSRNTLELHLDPDLTGSWDRFRLEQVIVNLLSNALKYAPQTPIRLVTYKSNNRAFLEVSDKGPGVDQEKIEKIFNRFERGSNATNVGGLGLGLFITRKIVEHHLGRITVESSPGRGARFIVELPLK
jgi:PAS domain S-box-containing protein